MDQHLRLAVGIRLRASTAFGIRLRASDSCLDGSSARQRGTAAWACTSQPRNKETRRSLPAPRTNKTLCRLGPSSYSRSRGRKAGICARCEASWSTRTLTRETQSCATGPPR